METRNNRNGWPTFWEHWYLGVMAAGGLVLSQVLTFFERSSSLAWLLFLGVSFGLLLVGAALIGYAKWPVYRGGQFFAFGLRAIPAPRHWCYRWGWGLFLVGLVLGVGLTLSRP